MDSLLNPQNAPNNTHIEVTFKPVVILYGLLIVVTIGGNVVVIMAFYRDHALKTLTNYYIISLSLTDIILAATVMPIAGFQDLTDGKWIFGDVFCDLFIGFDVLCCSCSIFHLLLIALDRYLCVTFPITYPRRRTKTTTLSAIVGTWCICCGIGLPQLLGWKDQRDPYTCSMSLKSYQLFSSLLSFYIPFIITGILYIAVYMTTRRQRKKMARKSRGDRLLSFTLNKLKSLENRMTRADRDAAMNAVAEFNQIDRMDDQRVSIAGISKEEPMRLICHHAPLKPVPSDPARIAPARCDCDVSTMNRESATSTRNQLEAIQEIVKDPSSDSGIVRYCVGTVSTVYCDVRISSNPANNNQSEPAKAATKCAPIHDFLTPFLKTNDKDDDETESTTSPQHSHRNFSAIGAMLAATPGVALRRIQKLKGRSTRYADKTSLERIRQKQESRTAKTVVIVLGVFFVCWIPFFLINVISPLCDSCLIEPIMWKLFTWLGYMNSALNPFIYAYFNINFRRGIVGSLTCCFKR